MTVSVYVCVSASMCEHLAVRNLSEHVCIFVCSCTSKCVCACTRACACEYALRVPVCRYRCVNVPVCMALIICICVFVFIYHCLFWSICCRTV